MDSHFCTDELCQPKVSMEENQRALALSGMQRELFGAEIVRKLGHVKSSAQFADLVARMAEEKALSRFRVWFVGSVLRKPQTSNDIDCLLTRRDTLPLGVRNVEDALYAIRSMGIVDFNLNIDPCFRNHSDDLLAGPLVFGDEITTWKLESPGMARSLRDKLPISWRRCGKYLCVFRIEVEYMGYFTKLPHICGTGATENRFLQPGVLLDDCVSYYGSGGSAWPPGFIEQK